VNGPWTVDRMQDATRARILKGRAFQNARQVASNSVSCVITKTGLMSESVTDVRCIDEKYNKFDTTQSFRVLSKGKSYPIYVLYLLV
jgi:hypothetical protein